MGHWYFLEVGATNRGDGCEVTSFRGNGAGSAAGESSHDLSLILLGSGSCIDCMSWDTSGQVYWVWIEASSDLQWDTSDPVHAKEGALILLRSVLAEKVEAPAVARHVSHLKSTDPKTYFCVA